MNKSSLNKAQTVRHLVLDETTKAIQKNDRETSFLMRSIIVFRPDAAHVHICIAAIAHSRDFAVS